MRVLLDCDGVPADFVGCVLSWVKDAHGPRTRASITDFNIFKAWGSPELWGPFNEYVAQPGICRTLQVLPGALEFVTALREIGEVAIATSPYKNAPHWIPERIDWLEEHFDFKPDDICVWSKKHWIDAEVLIDDALHNALNFPGVVFLIDQPWNQSESLPENVTRCFGFDAVLDELKFYAHAGATRADMLKDCGPFALPKGP